MSVFRAIGTGARLFRRNHFSHMYLRTVRQQFSNEAPGFEPSDDVIQIRRDEHARGFPGRPLFRDEDLQFRDLLELLHFLGVFSGFLGQDQPIPIPIHPNPPRRTAPLSSAVMSQGLPCPGLFIPIQRNALSTFI